MSRRLKPLGIRQRVLMISLLPLLLFAFVLAGYFISTRMDDTQNALLERGQSMSRLLASASEVGLMLGNHEMLRNLGKGVSQEPDVADVVFLDIQFKPILRSRAFELQLQPQGPYLYQHNRHWYFAQPVQVTGISFQDFPEYPEAQNSLDTIGWVIVVLSNEQTLSRQQNILITGLLIMFGTLFITAIIAQRFGRRITSPIQGLSHVIERLQEGQLDTRAAVSLTGELKTLAQGINRMAARIQESKNLMEHRVESTTKQLRATLNHLEAKNHELELARIKADTANLAKDEFLARMSHELRTPMTSVLGFARLLDQTDVNDEQREYTRIINQTSTVLLTIIDDILDLSKLESDAIRLERIPFDAENLLLDVLEMQAPLAHSKGLELILHFAPETPRSVLGDPTRLHQIMTNLIANAIKFTETGAVEVLVDARIQSKEHCLLLIQVIDSGIGIPENQKSKLFRAFSQADTSITRRFGGSGLGLVITQKLTELMGGKIELSSESGQGTKINLSIPFTCTEAASQALVEASATDDAVLLYEPHPCMRKSLQALLARKHLKTDLAEGFDDFCLRAPQYNRIVWGHPPTTDLAQLQHSLHRLRLNFSARLVILCSSALSLPRVDAKTLILHKPVRPANLFRALLIDNSVPIKPATVRKQLDEGIDLLVAEDNDFNRLLITKILELAGIHSRQASSGLDVLAQVEQKVPDLILMDVHMPGMDGIEATRLLRKTCPDLPIIALTANIVPREHQALQDAGITKIMFKPINETELLDAVQIYCQRDITHPAPPAPGDNRLDRFEINAQSLKQEITRQIEGCQQGFRARDMSMMRHHAHQLLGIAGLYDMPELEAVTAELHQLLDTGSPRSLWQSLWRLQRLNKQPLPDAEQGQAAENTHIRDSL